MLAVLPSMGVEGPGGGRAAAAGELEGPAGGRLAAAGDELAMALAWRTKGGWEQPQDLAAMLPLLCTEPVPSLF